MEVSVRKAVSADVPTLRELIDASVRGLQAEDYTSTQIESALATVFGVDSQLITDGTYFVAEAKQHDCVTIAGCGGWSMRKTLYGSDHWSGREDELLDPRVGAAKIRAFFVHPSWARRGVGSLSSRPSSRILPFQHSNRALGNGGRDSLPVGAVRIAVAARRTSNYLLAGRSLVSCSESSEFPQSGLLRRGRRIGSASGGAAGS
jgi:hypothetical protein